MAIMKNVDINDDMLLKGITNTLRAGLMEVEIDMLAFKDALKTEDEHARKIMVAMLGAMISKARAEASRTKRDSIMNFKGFEEDLK